MIIISGQEGKSWFKSIFYRLVPKFALNLPKFTLKSWLQQKNCINRVTFYLIKSLFSPGGGTHYIRLYREAPTFCPLFSRLPALILGFIFCAAPHFGSFFLKLLLFWPYLRFRYPSFWVTSGRFAPLILGQNFFRVGAPLPKNMVSAPPGSNINNLQRIISIGCYGNL